MFTITLLVIGGVTADTFHRSTAALHGWVASTGLGFAIGIPMAFITAASVYTAWLADLSRVPVTDQ